MSIRFDSISSFIDLNLSYKIYKNRFIYIILKR
jgi:hypothetical protein